MDFEFLLAVESQQAQTVEIMLYFCIAVLTGVFVHLWEEEKENKKKPGGNPMVIECCV